MKDHIYPTSLAFNEAKCKNGLGEPAHNRGVCEKDVIPGRRMRCVCVCYIHHIVGTKVETPNSHVGTQGSPQGLLFA